MDLTSFFISLLNYLLKYWTKFLILIPSLWLDTEGIVAELHETEQINFVWHWDLLGLLVVELRVGQSFQS